ncbi:MAG: hypothetical protein AB8E87_06110 [Prochlorococcus sp.]
MILTAISLNRTHEQIVDVPSLRVAIIFNTLLLDPWRGSRGKVPISTRPPFLKPMV